ncbi:beta strand repeat-containing protein, partial [Belliella marina]
FEDIINSGPVTINGDTFTSIEEYIENIVALNETVTTLVDNGDGTYTHTSEDGTVTVVDVPASVVNQFEDIINSGPVTINGDTFNSIEEYIENIVALNETVTTLVDNGDGTYTHTSEDGTVTVVDVPASVVNQFEDIVNSGPVTINGDTFNSIEEYIENIVTLNETVTTLVDNGDGTYTYTSEDGTVTVVDVPASVVNQFEDIVNSGPVTINGDTFNSIEEYIENIVSLNETVTTLVDNGDGTYTHTSEDGTVTVVDVPASVVNQFEDIVNSGPVTINGDTFNSIEEYIENIVALNETVTTLVDNGDGTYTHTSEDGTVTVVDVPASVVNQFEDIVNSGPVTINGDTFNSIEEYIENIVALNETVTTLVDNGDGTYTHTSEDGTVTVVDVPASVVNQFEDIINSGPVTINGDTFTSIEEYIENIVALNETVTTLVDNGDGTYTHTSEDGTVTVVDVPASVVNQFEDIVNSGPVTINGDTFTSIEEYIENIVALNETVTTLVDNGDGTYTYTSEDGTVTVVDVPASVVNQFEDIVNSGPVTINGDTFNSIEEYIENIVSLNETVTTLVDNGDGTYTYTSEDGTVTVVDVPGDVVTNIQNEGDIYNEIINLIETNSDILVDNGDGTFTHTAADGTVVTFDANTTTLADNGDGSYTLTNANGDTITIDVIGDVVTNIQNEGDIYNEIINLIETNSDVLVDNGNG